VPKGNRAPKAAVIVAQKIIGDAVRDGLKPGDPLPPERPMLERYESARGTLREALRLLEFQGAIVLKPGPGGGPVLTAPDSSFLASTLVLLMQLNGAPFRSIVQVRTAMEPMISSLAASRIDNATLDQLAESVEQMRAGLTDQVAFLDANKRFHDLIALSSGNILFTYLIESLHEIMDGTIIGIDYPPHRRGAILKAHADIYDAIRDHDPQRAQEKMTDHMTAWENYAKVKYPEVLDGVIRWDMLQL
jgi:GntR family transcriptional repressor for pyruvate dehydrogenase complex